MKQGYLIIDVGTGNTRAGVFLTTGECVSINTVDTLYKKDNLYNDATYFDPAQLWTQVIQTSQKSIANAADVDIIGILSTSGREGAVLIDHLGEPFLGLPNIDNRGAEYEGKVGDESQVYAITGRWPCRYFTAYKLFGLKKKRENEFLKINKFTSISDWIGYMFTGVLVYEPSQACETLLFDTKNCIWSKDLCELYQIPIDFLPNINHCGEALGKIKEEISNQLGLLIPPVFLVGGSDTQTALKGVCALPGQIVITSGTTTPISVIVKQYSVDDKQRCWVNNSLEKHRYVIETNAGVTGLNYQRLKKIFFPTVSYSDIEKEMVNITRPKCICSLSTMKFESNEPFGLGAFIINTPVDEALSPADFAYAVLLDIAFGIKSNIDVVEEIVGQCSEEILGCGGGFNGRVFPQLLSNVLGKDIVLKEYYNQASIMGGVRICNNHFNIQMPVPVVIERFKPQENSFNSNLYEKWKKIRYTINNNI